MLRFSPNPDKIINAIAYFSSRCGGATKMKICKLLYYADKEHLLQYGRPITGDTYVRMEYGPTPSAGLHMMRGEAPVQLTAMFQAKVAVKGNDVRSLSTPDMNVFSRSDRRVMDEVIEKYGRFTAAQLSKMSHAEPTWQKTPENQLIDFDLFFEGRPDADLTRDLVKDRQSSGSTPGHRSSVHTPKARRSATQR